MVSRFPSSIPHAALVIAALVVALLGEDARAQIPGAPGTIRIFAQPEYDVDPMGGAVAQWESPNGNAVRWNIYELTGSSFACPTQLDIVPPDASRVIPPFGVTLRDDSDFRWVPLNAPPPFDPPPGIKFYPHALASVSSKTMVLVWRPSMALLAVGTTTTPHCMLLEATDPGSGTQWRDIFLVQITPYPNGPSGQPVAKLRPVHGIVALESGQGGKPTATRFFVENVNVKRPLQAGDVLSVIECPTGTACPLPAWVGFYADDFKTFLTFDPDYGTRGGWSFDVGLGSVGGPSAPERLKLRVLPPHHSRPEIEPAVWSAGFGGPHYVPLDRYDVETEPTNDDPLSPPYLDSGFMAGDLPDQGVLGQTSPDVDHFAFFVGSVEAHYFDLTNRQGNACPFDARLTVYQVADGVLSSELVVSEGQAGPQEDCPRIGPIVFDPGATYVVKLESTAGSGWAYVLRHRVFHEELEEPKDTDDPRDLTLVDDIFAPGLAGTFTSDVDHDWVKIHLPAGDALDVQLDDFDPDACGAKGEIEVWASDGSRFNQVLGGRVSETKCPTLTGLRYELDGRQVEATLYIRVRGPEQKYLLRVTRHLAGFGGEQVAWQPELLETDDTALRPGTCEGVRAVVLDDYSSNGEMFALYEAPDPRVDCSGQDPDVQLDAYGICRHLGQGFASDTGLWGKLPTDFGTIVYTRSTSAPPVHVVSMGANQLYGDGAAAGYIDNQPTILEVIPGEPGNDFYYDPYGECDEQTYPHESCKGDNPDLVAVTGSPSCRITQGAFLEGQSVVMHMTRWNQDTTVDIRACSSVKDVVCGQPLPQGVGYDIGDDIFLWDIPFGFAGTREVEVVFRLTAKSASGSVDDASYYVSLRVRPRTTAKAGPDAFLSVVRKHKPLAYVAEDSRIFQQALSSSALAKQKHAADLSYWQLATNVDASRTLGEGDRLQLHPQLETGRYGDVSGRTRLDVVVKNGGDADTTGGALRVWLTRAVANSSGQLVADPPKGAPLSYLEVPPIAAGTFAPLSVEVDSNRLLSASGAEPWIAGARALWFHIEAGDDQEPGNDLFGPVFVTPTRPPRACVECGGTETPGFAGAYSATKDVTGVIASVTPENPSSGDTVTVNVQVQFSGSGWTSTSKLRVFEDLQLAPTDATPESAQYDFPEAPKSGTLYGYNYEFVAAKPGGDNTLRLRALLDATNAIAEPGSGEANNQLPSTLAPLFVEIQNSAPWFASAAVTSATEDVSYLYEVQIADDDSVDFANLTLAVDGPDGLAFTGPLATCAGQPTRKCRTLSWTPDDADGLVGSHAVTLTACDADAVEGGAGACTDQAFVITVDAVDDSPEITSGAPSTTATEDAPYTYTVTASDEESATLTFVGTSLPAGMSLTPLDGTSARVSWTPGDAGVGTKGVIVTVLDGTGGSTPLAWSVTTANVNDAPVLGAPTDTTADEGASYSATLAISDVDNDVSGQGQTHACAKLSPTPAWLSVAKVGASCTVSGTPGNADTGSVTVAVELSDSADGSTEVEYTLTVSDVVNGAPALAAVDNQDAVQGTPVAIVIDAVDEDFASPGYDEDLVYTLEQGPAGADLIDNGTSVTFSWTPGNADVGGVPVTLRATDLRGAWDDESFTLTVSNVNDPPALAQPADAVLAEGESYAATLSATDPDTIHEETLSYRLMGGAPPGFTVSSTTGLMQLLGADDAQVGVWTVTVRVTDASLESDDASFTLTVNNVEETPVLPALADEGTPEDALYTRSAAASDPDPGAVLTYELVSAPAGMVVEPSTGLLSWTPSDADVGAHTVSVRVVDETLREHSTSFKLTVTNVNDPPSFTSPPLTTATEEQPYAYVASAADLDLDSGDALTFSATTLPAWLTFNSVTRTLASKAGRPDDDDVGDHPVVLEVTDGSAVSAEQAFTISVAAVNDSPVLETIDGEPAGGGDVALVVAEGATLSFFLAGSDADDAPDALSYGVDLNGSGLADLTVDALTGLVRYDATFHEAGEHLLFASVSDDDGAFHEVPFTLLVTDVNRAPVFSTSPTTSTPEDELWSYDADATDGDGETVSYSLLAGPGDMTIDPVTGLTQWTPDDADVGPRLVTIRASDGIGGNTDQAFTLTVTNTNDAPVFTTLPVTTATEGQPYSYVASASDDDGDGLVYSAPVLPGWLTFDAGTQTLGGVPDDEDLDDGDVTLQVSDGQGGVTTQVFTITISPVNDAPTLVAPTPLGTVAGAEGSPLAFTIAATDPDGPTLTYSASGAPTGAVVDASTGLFQWTPSYTQAGIYSVTLRASDGTLQAPRLITLEVANTDRAPVVNAGPDRAIDEGETLAVTITFGDPDGDAATLELSEGPAGATLTGATLTWTPTFADAGAHLFTFTASAGALTGEDSITVTVADVNQAPVLHAPPPGQVAIEDTLYTLDLTATDVDLPDGDVLTFAKQAGPAGLSVDPLTATSARVSFTPSNADVGLPSVTVRVTDASGAYDEQTFTLTVSNANDVPAFTSSPIGAASQGALYSYTATATDDDLVHGDVLTLSADTLPAWATFTPATGVLSGTPANDDVGPHDVLLRVTDAAAATRTQSFTIVVANANDAPAIDPVANQSVAEGEALEFLVRAFDIDGTVPSLTDSGRPAGASFGTAIDGDAVVGTFRWTPTPEDQGNYVVTFTASDGELSTEVEVVISVGNVNRPPTLAAIGAKNVAETAPLAFIVTATDPDVGDTVTLSATGGASSPFARGATFDASTGAFAWTPGYDDEGIYQVTFTARDVADASDGETVTITVTDTNRAPVFETPPTPAGTVNAAENAALVLELSATDADGDAIAYGASPLPSGAVLTGGTLSWTPGYAQAGDYVITLSASDGTATTTRDITISVANTDRPPTLSAPPTRAATEGVVHSFVVTGSDPDGDPVTLSMLSGPSGASFSGGLFSWTPSYTQQGTAIATFRASAGGLTTDASTTITVAQVNQAPSLGAPDDTTATQDEAWSATLVASDVDLGSGVSESLTFTLVDGPSGASLSSSATQATVSWTPGPNDVNPGTESFTVRVTDAGSLSAERTFDVTIANVNDPPVLAAIADTSTNEDAPFVLAATASDADRDAGLTDVLSFSLTQAPAGMTVDEDGVIRWTPGDEDVGEATVTVRVSDAADASDTETFTLTVSNTPDSPVFTSTPFTSAGQGEGYAYTAAATDPDPDDALVLSAPTLPAWLTFTPATGVLSGVPDNDDVGPHDVVLRATDATARFVEQSFTLTVTDADDPPVFTLVGDRAVAEGQTVTFPVTASDPDGAPVVVTLTGLDLPAAATFDGVTFRWVTAFDDAGSYTARFLADDGTATATLDVSIVVSDTNRAPVLATVGSRTVAEGETLTVVLDGSDADGDELTFSMAGVSGADPFAAGASLDAASRTLTWTPAYDAAGTYQVDASVSDGSLGDVERFSITVTDANRPPSFTASAPSETAEDATLSYTATAADPDDDALAWTLVTGPADMLLAQDTGVLTWTPDNDDVGLHPVELRVSDGRGGTATQAFTLTVVNVNDAPTFTSSPVTAVQEEAAYGYAVSAADVDEGATLTFSAETLPGWLTFDPAAQTLSGTPDDAEVGDHDVVLRVTDDAGAFAEQSFTVVVSARNDAPVLVDPTPSGTLTVAEGATLAFQIAATDAESDTLTYDVTGRPSDATIDPTSGQFSWVTDYADAGTRVLTLVADDGVARAQRTVTVTVTNTDRPPSVTAPSTANGSEGSLLSFVVVADDPDGEDVTLSLDDGPAGASFHPATGAYSWTPGYDDAGTYAATFRATSGGASTIATTTITIADTNRAPVVTSTPPTEASEDAPLSYVVTASDPDDDTLTFLYVSGPANASFDAESATLSWTPTGAQAPSRSFHVRVSDGRNGVVEHTFTIGVLPVNDAPAFLTTPLASASEDVLYRYPASASDEDGDVLSYTLLSAPAGMSVDPSSGEVTWLPGNDDVGDAGVTLEVSDGTATVTQSWTVVVANQNDPPAFDDTPPLTGTPPRVLLQEGDAFSWTPQVSDVDGGDSVTLALALAPGGMTLSAGVITWTPGNDDVGLHTVRVRATDASGATTTFEFTIEVLNTNDLPFFVSAPIDATVAEEDALVETVVAGDPDAGDELTFSLIGAPSGAAIDADLGTLTFTPDDDEVGSHSFVVRVTDAAGDFVEQTVTLVVTPVNDAPVLAPLANRQVDVGATLTVTLNATDPDGPSLGYSLVDGPAGMSVSGATLSYTPGADDEGSYEVIVSVSDGSASDEDTFNLVVGDGLLPPDLTVPADRIADEGSLVTAFVSASDPGGGSVTLSATGLPTGATFDVGLGVFEWAPTFSQAGVYPIAFSATGPGGTTTRTWRLTVRNLNRAPQFAGTNIALPEATETVPYEEPVAAADLDGDPITYSLVSGPAGVTVSPDGHVQWTPTFAQLGSQAVEVRASDGNGGQDQARFLIEVLPLDEDADELPDTWELANGLDPTVDDAALDPDGDGLTNRRELELGTDPFVSDAPTAPVPLSPLDEERVSTARPTLRFSTSTDPNGLALSYTVVVRAETSGGEAFRASGLVGDGPSLSVTLDVDLNEGARYEWFARAENVEGGRAESARLHFIVDAVNLAPPAPVLVAPSDGASVATAQPTLRASPVADPDGDAVVYVFSLRETQGGPATFTSAPVVHGGSGDVVFQVSDLLANGSLWFWDVYARDSRGLAGAPSETRRFLVDLDNLPPPTPTLVAPLVGERVETKPFSLVVGAVTDPEGLPVTYRFELSRSASYADAELFDTQAVADGEAAVLVTDAFLGDHPDGPYFWRASATDGATESDFVEGSFDLQTVNDPPAAPTLLAPADNALVTGTSVTLVASTSEDPEGDPIGYRFELTSADGAELLDSADAADDDSDGELSATFDGLVPGARYGWRSRASDGASASASALFTFRVEATNERPSAPVLLEPADGVTLSDATPSFRFAAALDPEGDPLTHDLEVVVNGVVVVSATSLSASEGEVRFVPEAPLPVGPGVWRARGRDAIGGGAWAERAFLRVDDGAEDDAGPPPDDDAGSPGDDAGLPPEDGGEAGDAGALPDDDAGHEPYVPPGERVVDVGGPPVDLSPGCACASSASLADGALGLGLVGLLALARRRRRRPAPIDE